MTRTEGYIPLYIHGGNHQAFVRYELCTWPDRYMQWVVYCPGCEHMARSVHTSYAVAYDVALEHRIDEESWLPPEALSHGPRRLWGPAADAASKRDGRHAAGQPEQG